MQVTDPRDLDLIGALQAGLPLVAQPYAALGAPIGMAETEVIARLGQLIERGIIRRFGVIVRHHELGYRANGMTVWDVPDACVAEVGRRMAELPFVTLCYLRPRRGAAWPYNLFCMIHGKERAAVRARVEQAAEVCGLRDAPREVLFSRTRFKQRGAQYLTALEAAS